MSMSKNTAIIVAAGQVDSQVRRDGRPLDFLGHYNPMVEPAEIVIDKEKLEKWTKEGAKPTDTVRSLIKQAGA